MIRVGINGFGRIGRVISRIIQAKEDIEVVIINDINPDINNIAYLYKLRYHILQSLRYSRQGMYC